MNDNRERYTFTLHRDNDKELYEFLKDKSPTKIAKIVLTDYMKNVHSGITQENNQIATVDVTKDVQIKELINLMKEMCREIKGLRNLVVVEDKNKNNTQINVDVLSKLDGQFE